MDMYIKIKIQFEENKDEKNADKASRIIKMRNCMASLESNESSLLFV